MESVPYKQETGQKGFFAQESHRVLLGFTTYKYVSLLKVQNFLGLSFSSLKRGFC